MEIPISKMHRAQMALMIDFLGIPVKEQNNQAKWKKEKLMELKRSMPQEYRAAYDSVILHKVATGAVEKVIPFTEASRLITETVSSLEAGALRAIQEACELKIKKREEEMEEIQKNFVQSVSLKFKEAVDRESKKFNVIAVKINEKPPKKLEGVVHEKFVRLIQLASARKNILLVGPSGCGKTHVAEQIAKALDLRYGSQSCSAGISESVFSGWLIPVGKSGQFVYVSSVFVDLYENGGLFNFDEMDNSDANVLVFLNQALANGKFFLPQRTEKPMVVKHKDFVAVGCANTFGGGADGMYHGRIALDAATLDRFRVGTVYLDYSPAVEESLVLPNVLEWGREIRSAIARHKMKKVMSTRVLIDASDMIKNCGWEIKDIEEGYFADWSRDEKALCGFQNRGVIAA